MQQTVVNIAETRHENVVNNLKQEATIHYENKVLEVVTEASGHIEAANTRAVEAEQQAKQAREQNQHMREFMQAEIARQAESQLEETRQKEMLALEVQRLQAEVQQMRLLPIVFNEQSTEAGSVGRCPSTHNVSTPPSTPTLKSQTQNFFESVFGNLNRPIMTYAPTMLAPTGVASASFDKNSGPGFTKPPELPSLFPGGSNTTPAGASAAAPGTATLAQATLITPGSATLAQATAEDGRTSKQDVRTSKAARQQAEAGVASSPQAAQGSGQQQPQQQPQPPNTGDGGNQHSGQSPNHPNDGGQPGDKNGPPKSPSKGRRKGGGGGGGGDGDGGGDSSDPD